ncbi:RagB/SusD family nutrient uptake outer membrane protein [Sphingobacterium sp. SGG-5]|uniref:RagB/SusD family nutrient uptake outer membrane protein n=1 Tax=Sphingobacterium sp. SGG-5 TaxID=2710881 RepID=UPI0013ECC560|nr:RagB/SusD family nutrient uptake outer membrane protein [Sphingobacterium sp. SGG-5]NGM61767.1 RagB/SusD family nutrient uptake outer membrane protein [Sphingobacterium sp. SGG-5]
MKTLNKFYILLGILVLCSSCDKFLSVNPDNRVRPTLTTDYQAIMAGAYPGGEHLFTELYTDNFRFYNYTSYNNGSTVTWFLPLYLWSDEYVPNNVSPDATWRNYYNYIYKTNIILEQIDDSEGTEQLKRAVKAEAHLVRAYCHFMLVNIFAKHYNANTASNDLGVPIVRATEKDNQTIYKRHTVQEVYDFVEEEIFKGLALLDESVYKVPKHHFTNVATYAFLSRFYLFKSNWEESLRYSNMVFDINYSIRDIFTDFDAYFLTSQFGTFAYEYFSVSKPNVLLMNYSMEWISYFRSGFYANEFKSTFATGDIRFRMYTNNGVTYLNWNTSKYKSLLSDNGNRYSDVPLFVLEEVIFNAAEAYVKKDNPDFEKAAALVNDVIEQRFRDVAPPYLDASSYSDVQSIFADILIEKNRELCYEGIRWFDLKRLNIPISHYDGTKYVDLPADDLRRVVQIPLSELSANPDIFPNPR